MRLRRWTLRGEILQALSSMRSSTLDLSMINLWLRLKKGTVEFTKTKITVCGHKENLQQFLTRTAGMMSAAASLGPSLL